MMNHPYNQIDKEKQHQILKLVTNSFFRELVNYGVDASDIITVSVNLLDYVTKAQNKTSNGNGYYNNLFTVAKIKDDWEMNRRLILKEVCIKPLTDDMLAQISFWLKTSEIEQTFIRFLPKEVNALNDFFKKPDVKYFAIFYDTKQFVGIIGAEKIDDSFKKLEMKKFIGAKSFRGKGIGKLATFLFLYYVFEILDFHKVYIHSMDTNIKNINLNSKFGFELEGILYKDARLDNSFRDVLRMGLLRENWRGIFSSREK